MLVHEQVLLILVGRFCPQELEPVVDPRPITDLWVHSPDLQSAFCEATVGSAAVGETQFDQ